MKSLRIGLLIIILGVIALFLLRNVPTPPKKSVADTSLSSIKVQAMRITDASASIKYKIDVSYPHFSGMSNQSVQNKINTELKKRMDNNIARFKNEVNTNEETMGNAPPEIQNFINEYTITYKVSQATNKLVSVHFAVMDFQAGAAHPNSYNQVFNYDIATNKTIALADVFKPDTDYLQTLSNRTRQQLKSRFKDDPFASQLIAEGTEPEEENFELFNLGQQEIILIFNPSQVAADFAGTQTVSIPFTSLQSLMKSEYSQ